MTMTISYAREDMPLAEQKAIEAVAGPASQPYTLTLRNESARDWTFFVYQKAPQPSANVFSLAWFCSPYKIRVGNHIKFKWSIDYNFVWSDTGKLTDGVEFEASGTQPGTPSGKNNVDFEVGDAPGLDDPYKGESSGSLVIHDGANVPNNRFSVGIGMSGAGTYVVQAGPNLKHTFTPTPNYWIAAGDSMQVGKVLKIDTINQTSEVNFPVATYDREYVLDANNQWIAQ